MARSTHRFIRRCRTPALLATMAVLSAMSHGGTARAEAAPGVVVPQTSRAMEAVRAKVLRGRVLLDAGDRNSITVLRAAAQESIGSLAAVVGPNVFAAPPANEALDEFAADIIDAAAQAHYWWGFAAENFGSREEAITALARGVRLAHRVPKANPTLERDALLALRGALRNGLPVLAADDTFDVIAEIAHGNLWTPRRSRFDFSDVAFVPSLAKADRRSQSRELLITSGKLFPPQNSQFDPGAGMSRIPPLYRTVDPLRLPSSLQLDKMVVGFAREADGPNRGLWRQVVRVFYASPFITKDSRDDQPRAEALCEQFLKIHTLMRAGLGVGNAYASDGVTTLWLSEVSSWWPLDEDDPAVRAALPPPPTKVNTPLTAQEKPQAREVENTPLWYPWRAAGQIDSAPGEIMFFKMTEPRTESEWLRETIHEYGHVALPPFSGFRPPLEPYANGLLGETLGMMWAAGAGDAFTVKTSAAGALPVSAGSSAATLNTELARHVSREAIPNLHLWNKQGPYSPLRRDGTRDGLRYLQGLVIHLERVYGAQVLGDALRPLGGRGKAAADNVAPPAHLDAASLLARLPNVLRDPFGATGVLPVWLPGALETTTPDDAPAHFIKREPLRLRARERVSGWLFVPSTTAGLRVEWKDARLARGTGAPALLQIEGAWKVSNPAPLLSDGGKALRVDVKALSGWQRFTFMATNDLILTAAAFERERAAAVPR